MARKSGAIIKSRNRKHEYMEGEKVQCPICKFSFEPTEYDVETVCNTKTYWCISCGEQFVQDMRCYDYKYS